MLIKQLSVFLEDKVGRLAELTNTLAENGINLIAFSVADAADYGIARFIVDQPDTALSILKEKHFAVSATHVVGVIVPNQPGGLSKVLQILSAQNITIDYMYAFQLDQSATVIIRSASNEKVIEALENNELQLLKVSDLYKL